MSRSRPNRALAAAGNVALGALTFFSLRAIYAHVEKFIVSDPFDRLRQEEKSGLAGSVGIELRDVHVNAYRDGKLITSAMADQIDVNRQDRELFTLIGIRDGHLTEDHKQYRYSANQAVWQGMGRQLTMSGQVRVQNADLDLRTDSVEFNDTQHIMATPSPISGRLYHGTMKAVGFKLDTRDQHYTTGPVEYAGDLAMIGQAKDDSESTLHRWNVTGASSKAIPAEDGHPAVTYYVEGRAADDEMILKADLVASYKETDRIEATGNVRYFSGKADISADRATIFRREKKVILVGHVTIFVKPKADQDKPPVEEPLPPFKRVKPEEMVATPPAGAASGAAASGAGASGAAAGSKTGSSAPGKGTSTPPPGSGGTPPVAPPVTGPVTAPVTGPVTGGTAPSAAATDPGRQTPAPTPGATPAGQTSAGQASVGQTGGVQTGGAQTSRPTTGSAPASTPPSKAGQKAPKKSDEQKKLDDELRNGKSVRKYPMTIVCDEVDYWYRKGSRHGHIVGSPQGRQDLPQSRWRYVWSNSADYDAENDELTLHSSKEKHDVHMKNSVGDDVVALAMTVSTKEDADEEAYSAVKPEAALWDDGSDEDTATSTDKAKKKG